MAAAHPPSIPLEATTIQPTAPLPELAKGQTLETLLTPTTPATPDPGYVHLGTLRVDAKIFDEFKKSEQYLAKDPEAVKLLAALVNDQKPHTIVGIDKHDAQGDRFDPAGDTRSAATARQEGGTIYWDPHSALRNTDGTTQTAALALLHEQGHSWEWTSNPSGLIEGAGTKTLHYTNAEEQRNEKGLETRAAELLGEGKRADHFGTPYEVATSISRDSIEPRRELTPLLVRLKVNELTEFYAGNGYEKMPRATHVEPWDHKPHQGSFVALDQHTVAQSIGGGKYQTYDVEADLGGKFPPQLRPLAIDEQGRAQEVTKAKAHELIHAR